MTWFEWLYYWLTWIAVWGAFWTVFLGLPLLLTFFLLSHDRPVSPARWPWPLPRLSWSSEGGLYIDLGWKIGPRALRIARVADLLGPSIELDSLRLPSLRIGLSRSRGLSVRVGGLEGEVTLRQYRDRDGTTAQGRTWGAIEKELRTRDQALRDRNLAALERILWDSPPPSSPSPSALLRRLPALLRSLQHLAPRIQLHLESTTLRMHLEAAQGSCLQLSVASVSLKGLALEVEGVRVGLLSRKEEAPKACEPESEPILLNWGMQARLQPTSTDSEGQAMSSPEAPHPAGPSDLLPASTTTLFLALSLRAVKLNVSFPTLQRLAVVLACLPPNDPLPAHLRLRRPALRPSSAPREWWHFAVRKLRILKSLSRGPANLPIGPPKSASLPDRPRAKELYRSLYAGAHSGREDFVRREERGWGEWFSEAILRQHPDSPSALDRLRRLEAALPLPEILAGRLHVALGHRQAFLESPQRAAQAVHLASTVLALNESEAEPLRLAHALDPATFPTPPSNLHLLPALELRVDLPLVEVACGNALVRFASLSARAEMTDRGAVSAHVTLQDIRAQAFDSRAALLEGRHPVVSLSSAASKACTLAAKLSWTDASAVPALKIDAGPIEASVQLQKIASALQPWFALGAATSSVLRSRTLPPPSANIGLLLRGVGLPSAPSLLPLSFSKAGLRVRGLEINLLSGLDRAVVLSVGPLDARAAPRALFKDRHLSREATFTAEARDRLERPSIRAGVDVKASLLVKLKTVRRGFETLPLLSGGIHVGADALLLVPTYPDTPGACSLFGRVLVEGGNEDGEEGAPARVDLKASQVSDLRSFADSLSRQLELLAAPTTSATAQALSAVKQAPDTAIQEPRSRGPFVCVSLAAPDGLRVGLEFEDGDRVAIILGDLGCTAQSREDAQVALLFHLESAGVESEGPQRRQDTRPESVQRGSRLPPASTPLLKLVPPSALPDVSRSQEEDLDPDERRCAVTVGAVISVDWHETLPPRLPCPRTGASLLEIWRVQVEAMLSAFEARLNVDLLIDLADRAQALLAASVEAALQPTDSATEALHGPPWFQETEFLQPGPTSEEPSGPSTVNQGPLTPASSSRCLDLSMTFTSPERSQVLVAVVGSDMFDLTFAATDLSLQFGALPTALREQLVSAFAQARLLPAVPGEEPSVEVQGRAGAARDLYARASLPRDGLRLSLDIAEYNASDLSPAGREICGPTSGQTAKVHLELRLPGQPPPEDASKSAYLSSWLFREEGMGGAEVGAAPSPSEEGDAGIDAVDWGQGLRVHLGTACYNLSFPFVLDLVALVQFAVGVFNPDVPSRPSEVSHPLDQPPPPADPLASFPVRMTVAWAELHLPVSPTPRAQERGTHDPVREITAFIETAEFCMPGLPPYPRDRERYPFSQGVQGTVAAALEDLMGGSVASVQEDATFSRVPLWAAHVKGLAAGATLGTAPATGTGDTRKALPGLEQGAPLLRRLSGTVVALQYGGRDHIQIGLSDASASLSRTALSLLLEASRGNFAERGRLAEKISGLAGGRSGAAGASGAEKATGNLGGEKSISAQPEPERLEAPSDAVVDKTQMRPDAGKEGFEWRPERIGLSIGISAPAIHVALKEEWDLPFSTLVPDPSGDQARAQALVPALVPDSAAFFVVSRSESLLRAQLEGTRISLAIPAPPTGQPSTEDAGNQPGTPSGGESVGMRLGVQSVRFVDLSLGRKGAALVKAPASIPPEELPHRSDTRLRTAHVPLEMTLCSREDGSMLLHFTLRQLQIAYPYVFDLTLLNKLSSIFEPLPAPRHGPPSFVTEPLPWLHVTVSLKDSQIILPVCSTLPTAGPSGELRSPERRRFGKGATAAIASASTPPQPLITQNIAEKVFSRKFVPFVFRPEKNIDFHRGLALTLGDVHVRLSQGGDGELKLRVGAQAVSARFRASGEGRVRTLLAPASLFLSIDMAYPMIEESRMQQRQTQAARVILRGFRRWRLRRQLRRLRDQEDAAEGGSGSSQAFFPRGVLEGRDKGAADFVSFMLEDAGLHKREGAAGAFPPMHTVRTGPSSAAAPPAVDWRLPLTVKGTLRIEVLQARLPFSFAPMLGDLAGILMQQRIPIKEIVENVKEAPAMLAEARGLLGLQPPPKQAELPIFRPSILELSLETPTLQVPSDFGARSSQLTPRHGMGRGLGLRRRRKKDKHMGDLDGIMDAALELLDGPDVLLSTYPEAEVLRMGVKTLGLSFALCDDRPTTHGAPDILLANITRLKGTVEVQQPRPEIPGDAGVRLTTVVSLDQLSPELGRWVSLLDPWRVSLEAQDILSRGFQSSREVSLRVEAPEPANLLVSPEVLQTAQEVLSLAQSIGSEVDLRVPGALPTARQKDQLLSKRHGVPMGPASEDPLAAEGLQEPPEALEVIRKGLPFSARAPAKYFLWNQTGSRLSYWSTADRLIPQGEVFSVGPSEVRELLVTPGMRPCRVVGKPWEEAQGGARKDGPSPGGLGISAKVKSLFLQLEGNLSPVCLQLEVPSRSAYEIKVPAQNLTLPLLVDIVAEGRTKTVVVRSPFKLSNGLSRPLNLQLRPDPQLIASPSDSPCALREVGTTLAPGESFYLPIAASLGSTLTFQVDGFGETSRQSVRIGPDILTLKSQEGYLACRDPREEDPFAPPSLHIALQALLVSAQSEDCIKSPEIPVQQGKPLGSTCRPVPNAVGLDHFRCALDSETLVVSRSISEPLEAHLLLRPTTLLRNTLPVPLSLSLVTLGAEGDGSQTGSSTASRRSSQGLSPPSPHRGPTGTFFFQRRERRRLQLAAKQRVGNAAAISAEATIRRSRGDSLPASEASSTATGVGPSQTLLVDVPSSPGGRARPLPLLLLSPSAASPAVSPSGRLRNIFQRTRQSTAASHFTGASASGPSTGHISEEEHEPTRRRSQRSPSPSSPGIIDLFLQPGESASLYFSPFADVVVAASLPTLGLYSTSWTTLESGKTKAAALAEATRRRAGGGEKGLSPLDFLETLGDASLDAKVGMGREIKLRRLQGAPLPTIREETGPPDMDTEGERAPAEGQPPAALLAATPRNEVTAGSAELIPEEEAPEMPSLWRGCFGIFSGHAKGPERVSPPGPLVESAAVPARLAGPPRDRAARQGTSVGPVTSDEFLLGLEHGETMAEASSSILAKTTTIDFFSPLLVANLSGLPLYLQDPSKETARLTLPSASSSLGGPLPLIVNRKDADQAFMPSLFKRCRGHEEGIASSSSQDHLHFPPLFSSRTDLEGIALLNRGRSLSVTAASSAPRSKVDVTTEIQRAPGRLTAALGIGDPVVTGNPFEVRIPLLTSGQTFPIRLLAPVPSVSLDPATFMTLELSFSVTSAGRLPSGDRLQSESSFALTRCLIARSRFIFENESGIPLLLKQRGLEDTPPVSPEEFLHSELPKGRGVCLVAPGAVVPIHWPRSDLPKELIMRPAPALVALPVSEPPAGPSTSTAPLSRSIAWRWSGGFSPEMKDTYLGLRIISESADASLILPIHVAQSPEKLSVLTVQSPDSVPPYRIENLCEGVRVLVHQAGIERQRAAAPSEVDQAQGNTTPVEAEAPLVEGQRPATRLAAPSHPPLPVADVGRELEEVAVSASEAVVGVRNVLVVPRANDSSTRHRHRLRAKLRHLFQGNGRHDSQTPGASRPETARTSPVASPGAAATLLLPTSVAPEEADLPVETLTNPAELEDRSKAVKGRIRRKIFHGLFRAMGLEPRVLEIAPPSMDAPIPVAREPTPAETPPTGPPPPSTPALSSQPPTRAASVRPVEIQPSAEAKRRIQSLRLDLGPREGAVMKPVTHPLQLARRTRAVSASSISSSGGPSESELEEKTSTISATSSVTSLTTSATAASVSLGGAFLRAGPSTQFAPATSVLGSGLARVPASIVGVIGPKKRTRKKAEKRRDRARLLTGDPATIILAPGVAAPFAWMEPLLPHEIVVEAVQMQHGAVVGSRPRPSAAAKFTVSLDKLGDLAPVQLEQADGALLAGEGTGTGEAWRREADRSGPSIFARNTRVLVHEALLKEVGTLRIYASVFADGPCRVLRLSSTPHNTSKQAERALEDVAAQIKQIEEDLAAVNARFAALQGRRGLTSLDLLGRPETQQRKDRRGGEASPPPGMSGAAISLPVPPMPVQRAPALPVLSEDRPVQLPAPVPALEIPCPPTEAPEGTQQSPLSPSVLGALELGPGWTSSMNLYEIGGELTLDFEELELRDAFPAPSSSSAVPRLSRRPQLRRVLVVAEVAGERRASDVITLNPSDKGISRLDSALKFPLVRVASDILLSFHEVLPSSRLSSLKGLHGLKGGKSDSRGIREFLLGAAPSPSELDLRQDNQAALGAVSSAVASQSAQFTSADDTLASPGGEALERLVLTSPLIGQLRLSPSALLDEHLRTGGAAAALESDAWHILTTPGGRLTPKAPPTGRLKIRVKLDMSPRTLMLLKLRALEEVFALRSETLAMLQPLDARTTAAWLGLRTRFDLGGPSREETGGRAPGLWHPVPLRDMGPSAVASVAHPPTSQAASPALPIAVPKSLSTAGSEPGLLSVRILAARNLPENRGLLRRFFGNQPLPFTCVEILVPGFKSQRTGVVGPSLAPDFTGRGSQIHTFDAVQLGSKLTLRLLQVGSSKNLLGRRHESALGSLEIPCDKIYTVRPVYAWLPLEEEEEDSSSPSSSDAEDVGEGVRHTGGHLLRRKKAEPITLLARLQWTPRAVTGIKVWGEVKLASASVTVLSNAAGRELLRLVTRDLRLSVLSTRLAARVQGSVQWLGVEDQSTTSASPVVVYPAAGLDGRGDSGPPVARFGLTRSFVNASVGGSAGRLLTSTIPSYQDVSLELQPLEAVLDDTFLSVVANFVFSLPLEQLLGGRPLNQTADYSPGGGSGERALGLSSAAIDDMLVPSAVQEIVESEQRLIKSVRDQTQAGSFLFIENLLVGSIRLRVSVRLTSRLLGTAARHGQPQGVTPYQRRLENYLGRSGWQLINVSNATIELAPYRQGSLLASNSALVQLLLRHYVRQGLLESHKVLAGVGPSPLGLPLTVLWTVTNTLSLGYEVTRRKLGPTGALQRLGHNVLTGAGLLSSASARTLLALLVLTGDPVREGSRLSDQALLDRYAIRPRSAPEAFRSGLLEMWRGLLAGLAGVPRDTQRGFARGGLLGGASGLVRGAAGLGLRPFVGMSEGIGRLLQGMGLAALGREGFRKTYTERSAPPQVTLLRRLAGTRESRRLQILELLDRQGSEPSEEEKAAAAKEARERQFVQTFKDALPLLHPNLRGPSGVAADSEGERLLEILEPSPGYYLLVTTSSLILVRSQVMEPLRFKVGRRQWQSELLPEVLGVRRTAPVPSSDSSSGPGAVEGTVLRTEWVVGMHEVQDVRVAHIEGPRGLGRRPDQPGGGLSLFRRRSKKPEVRLVGGGAVLEELQAPNTVLLRVRGEDEKDGPRISGGSRLSELEVRCSSGGVARDLRGKLLALTRTPTRAQAQAQWLSWHWQWQAHNTEDIVL